MEYVALGIAVFLGGIVSGFAGFAFSAVAGAILLYFLPPLLAIPLMMCCSVASQMTSLAMLRRLINWHEITPFLIGGAMGVPIALYLLTRIDGQTFRVAFGIFLVLYALYMLARPGSATIADAHSGAAIHSAVGFLGGLLGGLTAMPGGSLVIWCDLRGISKEQQRGLVQPYILAMQVFAIVLLLCRSDAIDDDLLKYLLLALPALAAGTFIGVALFGKIDDKKFRYSVLSLLLISGSVMIASNYSGRDSGSLASHKRNMIMPAEAR
jgi:uncharacterized membrane protein YfcA